MSKTALSAQILQTAVLASAIAAIAATATADPELRLTAAPAQQTITAGETARFEAEVELVDWRRAVAVGVEGLPAGASALVLPGVLDETGTATIDVATTAETAAGRHSLTITALSFAPGEDGGKVTRTAIVTLEISADSGDFLIDAEPDRITTVPGAEATFAVDARFLGACTGPLAITATAERLDADRLSLGRDRLDVRASQTELTVRIPDDTRAGKLAIDVTAEGCGARRTDEVVVVVTPLPLRVTKSQASAAIEPGADQRYTITVENRGAAPLTGVTVIDTLDQHLTYRASSIDGQHTADGATHSFRLAGPLAAGARATVTIDTRVKDDLPPSTPVRNQAEVTARGLPGAVGSNTVTAAWRLDDRARTGLKLTKDVLRRRARVGAILVYRITVENIGAGAVSDLQLVDRLPAGFALVPGKTLRDGRLFGDGAGRGRVTWNLGRLPARGQTTLQYQVVVGNNARRGKNLNQAWVRGIDIRYQAVEDEARAVVMLGAADLEETGAIVVTVFEDRDRDGKRGAREPTLPGAKVFLASRDSCTTADDGSCEFAEVPPGSRLVALDQRSLPPRARVIGESSTLIELLEGERAEVGFPVFRARRRKVVDGPFLEVDVTMKGHGSRRARGRSKPPETSNRGRR